MINKNSFRGGFYEIMKTKEVKTAGKIHRRENALGTNNDKAYLMMVLPGGATWTYIRLFAAHRNTHSVQGYRLFSWNIKKSVVRIKEFSISVRISGYGIIFRNTLCYGAVGIILGAICPVALAVAFNKASQQICIKIYQTIAMLPYFISWIIVSYIVASFFDYKFGVLNHLIEKLGHKPIDWYTEIKDMAVSACVP